MMFCQMIFAGGGGGGRPGEKRKSPVRDISWWGLQSPSERLRASRHVSSSSSSCKSTQTMTTNQNQVISPPPRTRQPLKRVDFSLKRNESIAADENEKKVMSQTEFLFTFFQDFEEIEQLPYFAKV